MKKSMVRAALLSGASFISPTIPVLLFIPGSAFAQTVCTGTPDVTEIDIECTDGTNVVVTGTTDTLTTINPVPQGLSADSAAPQTMTLNPGPDGDTITTTADGAFGIDLNFAAIVLNAPDVNVVASGDNLIGVGLVASSITASIGDVTTTGDNAFGIDALSFGPATLDAGTVSTSGSTSTGVRVRALGGIATIDFTSISTTGASSPGLEVHSADDLTLDGGNISTVGDNSTAALLDVIAPITGTLGDLSTQGANSIGLAINTPNGTINFTVGDVTTTGANSDGVVSNESISSSTIGNVSATGAGSRGVRIFNGVTDLTIGNILSSQDGLFVDTATRPIDLTTGNVETTEDNAPAVTLNTITVTSTVNYTGGVITTAGDNSIGLDINGGDGAITATIAGASTSGNTSDGVQINGDGDVTFTSTGDITTAGDNSAGASLDGLNSLTATLGNVSTSGTGSRGVFADSLGGVDLTVGDVTTGGATSEGIFAAGKGGLTIDAGDITTSGDSSFGIFAASQNIIDITVGDITTTGLGAYGIQTSDEFSLLIDAGNISTQGDNAFGIMGTPSFDASIAFESISTAGGSAAGVDITAQHDLTVDGGDITTLGDNSVGASLDGLSSLTGTIGNVSTAGASSRGVFADSLGGIDLTIGDVTTLGDTSEGVFAAGKGGLTLDVGDITTSGDSSFGIFAASQNIIDITAGDITTSGLGAYGIQTSDEFSLIVDAGNISTQGDNAFGIMGSPSFDASIGFDSISTAGASASGLDITAGNNLTVDGGDIATLGANSDGADLTGSTISGTLGNVTATGAGSRAVVLTGTVNTMVTGDLLSSQDAIVINNGANPIDLTTGDVTTTEDSAPAVTLSSTGTIDYVGGTITTSGDDSGGLLITGGAGAISASITGGNTAGINSDAVNITGTGPLTFSNSGSIATTGAGSNAIDISGVTTADVTCGDASTTADNTPAIVISANGDTTVTCGTFTTTGANSTAIVVDNTAGTTTVTGGTTSATGAGSNGMDVSSSSNGAVTVNTGTVTSDGSAVLARSTGGGTVDVNVTGDVTSTGGDGVFISSTAAKTVTVSADSSVTADAAAITGGGGSTLTIDNSGALTGAGSGLVVFADLATATTINNVAGGVMNGAVILGDQADTINNAGTWNTLGFNFFQGGTDAVNNQVGGFLTTADGTNFDGLETLTNDGTFNANGTLDFLTVATPVTNTGTFNLNSATVTGISALSNSGTLTLDDSSVLNVAEFTQTAAGTVEFALSPIGNGTQPVGTYPQIFVAGAADLNGTLSANLSTANGLFASSFFDNVIDATTRSGTFSECVIGGDLSGSLLLSLQCIYDTDANVDLQLTRIAFSAVAGLNGNATAAATGLDCIFDPTLTGGVATLLADLFLITDQVNYNAALNMLAGEGYANYLQSFASLGAHYNDLLDRATSCEIPALAGSAIECRASSPIHVWGQVDYQKRHSDGDHEAGSSRAQRFTGILGVDAKIGSAALAGLSIGTVNNHVDEHQFTHSIDADGFEVGLYGVYDPGPFYVKAMGTYNWYDGDSARTIDLVPLGGTFISSVSGDPDVKMLTLGLHGGARFGGPTSVFTPYLNLDYVHSKLDGFIETTAAGLDGANLHIGSDSSSHTFLTGGMKWAGKVGSLVPEANLGYRYRFGDKRSTVTEAFNCQIDTCAFHIVSAGQKRGSFLAGLSLGGKIGRIELRAGYEGEFSGDVKGHSAFLKMVLPFGGRAAPAIVPPPAPVAAPLPPPLRAPEATAPLPPPPPPPSGERGN